MTLEQIDRITKQSFAQFLKDMRPAIRKVAPALDKRLLIALLTAAHSHGFETSAKIYWLMVSEKREPPETLDS